MASVHGQDWDMELDLSKASEGGRGGAPGAGVGLTDPPPAAAESAAAEASAPQRADPVEAPPNPAELPAAPTAGAVPSASATDVGAASSPGKRAL